MTLGYDDYGLTLGDEMRGCRAALGASLADVERDLRIRAKTILAIENLRHAKDKATRLVDWVRELLAKKPLPSMISIF